MQPFEKTYEEAIASGLLPGVALLVTNKDGSFTYNKTLGFRSKKDGVDKEPFGFDTICALASCTKPMTGVCVMQCVERGLLDLDADVRDLIPEYGQYGVINGWDEEKDEAVLEPRKGSATLRDLLTHTSGQYYDLAHPMLQKWRTKRGGTPWSGPTVVDKTSLPLVFQPGTSWSYGGGPDWAGKMVEIVTGKTLDEYMQENIWKPLGIKDMTFWPETRPDFKGRRADVGILGPDGKAVDSQDFDLNYGTKECLGGGGSFGSPEHYFKFIQAIFREDPALLKPESYGEFFRGQLRGECREDFKTILQTDPIWQGYIGHNIPPKLDRDFSIAGMIVKESQPGWIGENTITWGGLPCLIWWIDRQNDICCLAVSQMLPAMAPEIMKLHENFQRGIYHVYAESQKP